MADINGIAHIQLTVSNMERSTPIHETLLAADRQSGGLVASAVRHLRFTFP